nr:MAG TPA: hypothetical protein [Caudoviricetes sp.]
MKTGYVLLFCLSVWVAGYIGHRVNANRIAELEMECKGLREDLVREEAMVRTLLMQSELYAKASDFYRWGSLLRDSGLIQSDDLDSNLRVIFRLENLNGGGEAMRFRIPAGAVIDILRENLATQGAEPMDSAKESRRNHDGK